MEIRTFLFANVKESSTSQYLTTITNNGNLYFIIVEMKIEKLFVRSIPLLQRFYPLRISFLLGAI